VTREVEISWILAEACHSKLIVRCDGFVVNPPDLYVVMEMCEEGSLNGVLASARLGYTVRLQMACDVMDGMAHMHRLGFVHRDVKSLNVFVVDLASNTASGGQGPLLTPLVRLGDFGESLLIEEARYEKPKCVGTLQWMAPEIQENWRVRLGEEGSPYLPSADVFSATLVVWECLTAQTLYEDVKHPVKGTKLRGVDLADHIVAGLRPSTGAIPDGTGGVVSERIQAVVENGWQHNHTDRLSADDIKTVLQEELSVQHN